MVRHKMNPGTTMEQDERDDGYCEYIISKSYYSSSRKKIYHRFNVFIDDIIIERKICIFKKTVLKIHVMFNNSFLYT